MAAYIPVPRDLTRVKSKILFNLTKRQLLCFGAGALIGVRLSFCSRQAAIQYGIHLHDYHHAAVLLPRNV